MAAFIRVVPGRAADLQAATLFAEHVKDEIFFYQVATEVVLG